MDMADQAEYWKKEVSKYTKLYLDKAFKDKLTGDELDVYRYALWYCQEQRSKF